MTNRDPLALRPSIAALALIVGILAVAGSLPLASRLTGMLSHVVFGNAFYGPALSQLILLATGFVAFGIALHRSLRPLRTATEAGNR